MAGVIDIKVKVDGASALQYLDSTRRRQLPFATAVALTRTAKLVEAELKTELKSRLDSPSPYTLRSTYSTSATKDRLEARIGIKDFKPAGGTAPAVLLKEHFSGGVRGNKPMEAALIAMGILPQGWRVVPGAGMPVDSYGNPRRATVRELLGALRSRVQLYHGRGKRLALAGYFAVKPGAATRLKPGVYWRKGRATRPMLIFIKQAGYRKRFDLPKLAQNIVDRNFSNEFDAALDYALATAR